MHLKLKPADESVKALYEDHTSYHEGDSGLDLFTTEDIIIPHIKEALRGGEAIS